MKLDRMNGTKRTDYCGTLTKEKIGETVVVCGWVQRQRDLGGLIFVDLRDRTGIIQLAFDDSTEKSVFDKAFALRSEFVVMAKGKVRMRSSVNTEIPTGEIEIAVDDLLILGESLTPPFEILPDCKANEELRLKYRYLDLRRTPLKDNILMRHRITKVTRIPRSEAIKSESFSRPEVHHRDQRSHRPRDDDERHRVQDRSPYQCLRTYAERDGSCRPVGGARL